jgi:hypothetical protein
MILDFACARRNTFLALFTLNKFKNAPLPACEHIGQSFKAQIHASSNEHVTLRFGRLGSPWMALDVTSYAAL